MHTLTKIPAQHLKTNKQRREAALQLRWERNRRRWFAQLRQRYGPSCVDFAKTGEPLFRDRGKPQLLRGPELIRTLELARDVTGDARFDEARRLVIDYGLDRQFGHTAVRLNVETFGDHDEAYFALIEDYCRRGRIQAVKKRGRVARVRCRLSLREACQVVAVDVMLGDSFDQTVRRIAGKFREWRKSHR